MDILILEDDSTLGQLYVETLEESGHYPVLARRNSEAIALLTNQAYDLVICDLIIGNESTLQVLKFVRQTAPDTGVILVTGTGLFPRGELHYASAEVSFRLQKPVRIDDLAALVAHFDRTRAPRPAQAAGRASMTA